MVHRSVLKAAGIGLLVSFAFGCPALAEDRLADGGIARITLKGQDYSAWYGAPTTRYQHGILGDAIEAGSLHVKAGQKTYSIVLPEDQVFEDRTPRFADLDGDGRPEVIAIRSYLNSGGSVAVYGLRENSLAELASSRSIGKTNRWLNIAGIADFAGAGQLQIAFVETPHIGGTLVFTDWQGTKLKPIASLGGFSNHKIGAREQNLSAEIYFNGDELPDLIVPSNERTNLRIVGFVNGQLQEFARQQLPSPVARHIENNAQHSDNCAVFELENGQKTEICGQTPPAR